MLDILEGKPHVILSRQPLYHFGKSGEWDEAKHPRGQPENAGQFSSAPAGRHGPGKLEEKKKPEDEEQKEKTKPGKDAIARGITGDELTSFSDIMQEMTVKAPAVAAVQHKAKALAAGASKRLEKQHGPEVAAAVMARVDVFAEAKSGGFASRVMNFLMPSMMSKLGVSRLEGKLVNQQDGFRRQLSGSQRQALSDYSANEQYTAINNHLRHGKDIGKAAETLKGVDEAFDSPDAVLKEDVTVYRGVRANFFEKQGLDVNNLVGTTITDKGFMSTTIDAGITKRFLKDAGHGEDLGGAVIEIRVPKGSKGIYMGQGLSQFSTEAELLMPRGTSLQFTKASAPDARGRVRLVAELVESPAAGSHSKKSWFKELTMKAKSGEKPSPHQREGDAGQADKFLWEGGDVEVSKSDDSLAEDLINIVAQQAVAAQAKPEANRPQGATKGKDEKWLQREARKVEQQFKRGMAAIAAQNRPEVARALKKDKAVRAGAEDITAGSGASGSEGAKKGKGESNGLPVVDQAEKYALNNFAGKSWHFGKSSEVIPLMRNHEALGHFTKAEEFEGTGRIKHKKVARNVSEAARTLGHFGGKVGGPARARKLSADRRKEIAAEGGRASQGKSEGTTAATTSTAATSTTASDPMPKTRRTTTAAVGPNLKSLDQPHLDFSDPPDNNVDWLLWDQITAFMPTSANELPQLVGVIDGVNVYLVDGGDVFFTDKDFALAGNDLELLERHGTSYIPPRTVWVDALVDPSQWCFNCYHELAERRMMEHGVAYAHAHERVNDEEEFLRAKFGGKSLTTVGKLDWHSGHRPA
jgi:hypothetical protein